MFAYAMLGTNDVARAAQFYDPLMALLGQPRCWTDERGAAWGSFDDPAMPALSIQKPFDGQPATVGNGVMLAFRAGTTGLVDSLHAAAMAHGGRDDGLPGPRPQYGDGFYAAYVRDPDGNKLAFICTAALKA
ncbi:VOC family protein [Rhizobium pusense]|uniref:VOC family protein n=1 Tax=Agrobacterium pusense TaxID=648995 RepID=UPI001FCCFCFB|nr:VOC family protein [Agrobacterium pusense]MCJ2876618.1 VOC family protein [Agrobacterium pusense]